MIRLRDRLYTFEEASALARREQNLGNVRNAAEIYNLILAAAPDHAETNNNFGVVLQQMNRHAEALARFDRALFLEPNSAEALMNRGNILLLLRRIDEALASYDRLIALKPNYAFAHNSRGIALQEMKRHAEALASYDKAIELDPDYDMAHSNRGLLLKALQRYSEALASFDRAIELKSGNAVSHNNRGLALQEMKRHEEALASFDKALTLRPNYAAAHNNRGVTLQELNRHADALASYDRALALKPDYDMAYNNRGLTLKEMRRFGDALASFDRAIVLNPLNHMAYNNRGHTLQEMKLYDEALASCNKAIELNPDFAEAFNSRAASLWGLKLYDEALASCDRAIALKPDFAEAYHNRGVVLVNMGNMSDAEEMFVKALAIRPDLPTALFSLAMIHKHQAVDHENARNIKSLIDQHGAAIRDNDFLYFALGKIHDDCGHYDAAFDCYREANRILNAKVSYDPDKMSEITKSIIEVFSKDFLAQSFSFASDSRSPLFIVGMPRSGTTLTASILSNHRSIGTAGELPTLAQFTARLPRLIEKDIPYPQAVAHVTPAIASRLIEEYENRLRRDIGTELPHVIDKSPLNFRNLGFIAMLFPKARIVHCTRHPLDTCLSNFFQHFSLNYDYSFDLRNIGHFYGEYLKTMEHWRRVLPVEMLEVNYEDVIRATEEMVHRMLDFLGLEWDERCLAPHTNPNAVDTASNWQVRQPIYNQSVDRWRHYEKHLAPLREMLGTA
jgi:tetratricopeptide (TPR) repeat protein